MPAKNTAAKKKPVAKTKAKNTAARQKTKTTAQRAIPAPTRSGKTETTVSVRQISNGYVITETTSGPDTYRTKETFSKTKPVIKY